MTRRIWISKFRLNIRLGAIPFLIVGLIFLFYPDIFFRLFKDFNISPSNNFFVRMIGIFLMYVYLTFEYMAANPNYNRDLAFLQAVLLMGIALFIIIWVFVSKFSYYFLIISIYAIIFGIYLLLFASKNLLVRD